MADYIHLNILSQSYIHIEPVNIEDERLERFRAYMEEFVAQRSKFFLHPDVEVDIALREGSLKSYATVLGTLAWVYNAIGNYGGIRQGISILHEDCKRVAETVCSESLFQAQARHPDIVRVEARTA